MFLRICDPNTSTLEWRRLNFQEVPVGLLRTDIEFELIARPICGKCHGAVTVTCDNCNGTGTWECDCGCGSSEECSDCEDGKQKCYDCDDGYCELLPYHSYSSLWRTVDDISAYQSLITGEGFAIAGFKKKNVSQTWSFSAIREANVWNDYCALTFLLPAQSQFGYYSPSFDSMNSLHAYWTPLRARLAKAYADEYNPKLWGPVTKTLFGELKMLTMTEMTLDEAKKTYNLVSPSSKKKKAVAEKQ